MNEPTHSPTSESDAPLPRLLALALAALASIALGFFLTDETQAESLFILTGYPLTLILFACFALGIGLFLKQQLRGSWSTIWTLDTLAPALTCIAVAIFLYTREGGGFKIPFDEQLLTNVSQNMHRLHKPVMSETTFEWLASFQMIDKRPLLYPFVLSLVHAVLGYQAENAFLLNGILTAVFLFLLFKTVERIFSRQAGYFSIALAAFMPIIGQNASGGGFEMLNLCGILCVGLLCMAYWRKADSLTLGALLFATAATSNIRYESPLIILPVSVLVLAVWIREKKISLPWSVVAIPFLFLPLVWQFRAISANAERFQYETEGAGSFSLSYLVPNLEGAYRFFFIPEAIYASSPFVSFIGFAGLLFLGTFCLTRSKTIFESKPDRIAFLGIVFFCLIQMATIMLFFFGKLDVIITARLALPFILLLFICGGIALSLFARYSKFGKYAAYALLSFAALYSFKMYSAARYTKTNTVHQNIEWGLNFARSLPPGNHIFLTAMPKVFEVEDFNNLTLTRVQENLSKLKFHLELETYREIYVIQSGMMRWTENGIEKELLPIHRLSPAIEMETIEEVSFATHNFVRLSKVVDIDLSRDERLPPVDGASPEQFYSPSPEEIMRFRNNLL